MRFGENIRIDCLLTSNSEFLPPILAMTDHASFGRNLYLSGKACLFDSLFTSVVVVGVFTQVTFVFVI